MCFGEVIAPRHGAHALPALVDKLSYAFEVALSAGVVLLEDGRCATDAELSLAGAHAESGATPQVEQVVDVKTVDGIFDFANADLFTFADQGAVSVGRGPDVGGESAMTADSRFGPCSCRAAFFSHWLTARQRTLGGDTLDTFAAELAAYCVGGPLSHKAVGHQFATGDGDKTFEAVALSVVETYDSARDASS